jgi:hypothetical protein
VKIRAPVVSLIDPRNAAGQRVAERLGERRTGERFAPLGEPCDIWEIGRGDRPPPLTRNADASHLCGNGGSS